MRTIHCEDCNGLEVRVYRGDFEEAHFTKDRVITLRNIPLLECGHGPIFERPGPLADLVQANPQATVFVWNEDPGEPEKGIDPSGFWTVGE